MHLILKKLACALTIWAIVMTQVIPVGAFATTIEPTKKPNKSELTYDLVAVVIDTQLDENTNSYEGLRNQYPKELKDATISERVVRYSEDLRDSSNYTDVRVILFDRAKESVTDLANALENLYRNGDGERANRLSGVVLVGDIPLPIVNDGGESYLSMNPYADFEEKAFLYDSASKSYLRNTAVSFPKSEIWHGVIRSDDPTDLAEFFDKNHLYYEGVPEYSKFDKKIFFGDLSNEQKSMNPDIYKFYLNQLEGWEDLSYLRYTKEWAKKLLGNITSDIPINENNPEGVAFGKAIKSDNVFDQTPDIQTKNIISQYLIPYYGIFENYIGRMNGFVENTGRYTASDADNIPTLVSIKDEYTKGYLRSVNDALEKQVNEIADLIQEPIDLLKYSKLSGYFRDPEGNIDDKFEVAVKDLQVTPEFLIDNPEELYIRYNYLNEKTGEFFVNGVNAEVLDSAKQCSYLLGSGSGLVSASRANDVRTAAPVHTVGVNTRLVAPEEANKLTNNQVSHGALIADYPEYGISAFIDNPLMSDYKGPVEKFFKKGDLITKVNGEKIDSSNTFDQAIEESYLEVVRAIAAINGNKLDTIKDLVPKIATINGNSIAGDSIDSAIGNISIEAYRGDKKIVKNFTFTVTDEGVTNTDDATGTPEIIVLLSSLGYPPNIKQFPNILFEADSMGAIFTLYDTENQGFDNAGYDNSAGCNVNSAGENSDRCFERFAVMPVLDPAGSVRVTGGDVDQAYYNACFAGIPGVGNLPSQDSNPYEFVLDPDTEDFLIDWDITQDLYGRTLDFIGEFIEDYGDDPKKSPGKAVWSAILGLNAGKVKLNDEDAFLIGNVPTVTLKHYADRYGLFDGIDNDNDGIRDYEWRDLKDAKGKSGKDGIFETKYYDFDEADIKYGIDPNNLEEIYRKLLSHDSKYTIPFNLPNSPFDKSVTLNVNVSPYKKISSVILHNEPTKHTISEQAKAMGTKDLPIDKPRYVTFMSAPDPLPPFPGKKIAADTDPHYFPGQTVRIDYPNLFKTNNLAQLKVQLDQIAWKVAQTPGAYKLFGPNATPEKYKTLEGKKEIHDEVMKKYFDPVVTGQVDDPVDGFELKKAATEKVYDALEWSNLDIDGKYEYILLKHLNDGENSFVDDGTLFPATPGYEQANGYEAAYLVLDGEENYFNMGFNKDVPEETNLLFDPLAQAAAENGDGSSGASGKKSSDEDSDYEFVDLSEFLKETKAFLKYFTELPEVKDVCVFDKKEPDSKKPGKGGVNSKNDIVVLTYGYITDEEVETTTNITADGSSKMRISAALLDANKEIILDENITIKFSVIDGPKDAISFVEGDTAKLIDGEANVEIKAGTKAGDILVQAEVVGSDLYPTMSTLISLNPGEPSIVDIAAESSVLVSNNESQTHLKIVIKDKFGNVATNYFGDVAIFVNSLLGLDPGADVNKAVLGTQINAFEGRAELDVKSKNINGDGKIIVLVMGSELEERFLEVGNEWREIDFSQYTGSTKTIKMVDDLTLRLTPSSKAVVAGSDEVIEIKTELLNNGKIVSEYNGPINFDLLTYGLGSFSSQIPQRMTKGFLHGANVKFKPNKVAGMAEVSVEIPGITTETLKIEVRPDNPASLNLTANKDFIYSNPNEETILSAEILDQYGNLVTYDDSTTVAFETTQATKDFVKFKGAKSAVALGGRASVIVTGATKSGHVNIIANSEGLDTATVSFKVVRQLNNKDVAKISPRSLYVSLYGGDFGDLRNKNNLAQEMLYSGQVEALVSSTKKLKRPTSLFNFDGYGRINVIGNVASKVVLATGSFPYQKVVLNEALSGGRLATAFLVPKNNTVINVIDDVDIEIPDKEGIYLKKLQPSEKLVFEKDGEVLKIKDKVSGEVKLSVDKFGRISVVDSSIKLLLPEEGRDFGFEIIQNSSLIGEVIFRQNFSQDVTILDSDNSAKNFSPGYYLKIDSNEDKHKISQSYTRASNAEPFGVHFVDTENTTSRAVDNGYGFEGENKQMLLFSAGNSVGESNMAFGKLDEIVYGDPNVRLKKDGILGLISQFSGYSKDLGQLLFAGEESILEVLTMDFNGDGRDDILLVYEDGFVRLLENQISDRRFKDKGYVLNIYGGIYSAAAIDINNDGYDDLVVGTKESCKIDEICVSQFINTNGKLERKTLNLAIDGKALNMESYDMNLDGCSDLIVSDTSGNVRVFYNKNNGKTCSGLETNYGDNNSFSFPNVGEISFEIGNNLGAYAQDKYPDIRVRPAYNKTAELKYIYSDGLAANKEYVQYKQTTIAPKSNLNDVFNTEYQKTGLPDPDQLFDGAKKGEISADTKKTIKKLINKQNEDKDFDGLVDSWDSAVKTFGNKAKAVADGIQKLTSLMRCSGGGCLPIPYNFSFLTPYNGIPGFPAVNILSSFPYFVPFGPSTISTSVFRLYLSPTLTMGLGVAACATGGVCFAATVPLEAAGLCPDLPGAVNDAIAFAKNVSVSPDAGMSTVVSDGNASASSKTIDLGGATDANSPVAIAGKVNVKIPGFPSVITNWLDNQTDEIFNKLLDLPDIYLIYPDIAKFGSQISDGLSNVGDSVSDFNNIQNINDVLNAINSIPLIQIEGKQILVRVPTLSNAEIAKWKNKAKTWVEYEKKQLEILEKTLKCKESDVRKTICDTFSVKMTNLIFNVQNMMVKLDQIANLPRDILAWRQLEAKYATQLICYLDATMQYSGGYVTRQQKTMQSWMKAMEDTLRTVKTWKGILDLAAEYQKSCDECKNDRFGDLGLLMNLFVAIPTPPIIPIPKWPDLIVDVSQLKVGTKIVWPDLVFQPQSIILPNLPTISAPTDLIPTITLNLDNLDLDDLPGFPDIPKWLEEFPEFTMPDLPNLPPLPFPELPDLPRPPKIPAIPSKVATLVSDLKPVMKILCLLKKGFVPIPETKLKTEIETLTQPSVAATLPFFKQLGIQVPGIQYESIEKIKLNAKINVGVETEALYNTVKAGIDVGNELTEGLIDGINEYTELPWDSVIDQYFRQKINELNDPQESKPTNDKQSDADLTALNNEDYPEEFYLVAKQKYLNSNDPILNRSLAQVEHDISNQSLPDTPAIRQMAELRDSLIAYTKDLNKSNSLLQGIDDQNEFAKVLVDNNKQLGRLASKTVPSSSGGTSKIKTNFFDPSVENNLRRLALDTIAIVPDLGEIEKSSNNSGVAAPKGFIVAVGDTGENVLNYDDEIDDKMYTTFSDVDLDGDQDIIFTMGGSVYLKTNFTKSPAIKKGEVIVDPSNSAVSDFVNPAGDSIQGTSAPFESNRKADLSWLPKDLNEFGYEVFIRESIYDDLDDAIATYKVSSEKLALEIANGNYYATIFALDSKGERSITSGTNVVAPQICSDRDAPLPALSQTDYQLPIYKTIDIDASNSFDPSGEISEYYLEILPDKRLSSDINLKVDENGDGILTNDSSNPVFKVGPYKSEQDLGDKKAILHVVDQSGNSSKQELEIRVYAPEIILDSSSSKGSGVSGETVPKIANMPFRLMRERYFYRVMDGELKLIPKLEKVLTTSADKDGIYYTNADGEFLIKDFDISKGIALEDASGKLIAQINPDTGNIGNLAKGNKIVVVPAVADKEAMHIEIQDNSGEALAKISVVGDVDSDVRILKEETLNKDTVAGYLGVNVNDLDISDEIKATNIPANDPQNPGAAIISNGAKQLALIDTVGNISLLDDSLNIKLKDNDYENEPLIFVISVDGKTVFEVYIGVLNDGKILPGSAVPEKSANSLSKSSSLDTNFTAPFSDLDGASDELKKAATLLYQKGIIDGIEKDGDLTLQYGNNVARSEFVKVLLKMLCIVPRDPEAFEAYAADEAGGGFSDIDFSANDWFYPYVKEAALRGLVNGYKGEKDPASGLFPFKADATITRAEASKIILEALEMKGVLDLGGLTEGTPWYGPYIEAATDLTVYMKSGSLLKNNFIITQEEALDPNTPMTREDLIIMADRVLDVYDCSEIDSDKDGMSDFCEARYNVNDPNADQDGDGVTNAKECLYNLNPTEKDSDGGGIYDGDEIEASTNPLNPLDDKIAKQALEKKAAGGNDDKDGNGDGNDDGSPQSGIYIAPKECKTCPCEVSLTDKSDSLPGDVFFTVITSPDEKYIFSKSNNVVITD